MGAAAYTVQITQQLPRDGSCCARSNNFFKIKKYYLNVKLHYYPQPNQQLTKKKKTRVKDPNTLDPNELIFLDPRVHV